MEEILQVIKDKMEEWKDVDPQDILIERMTGITN